MMESEVFDTLLNSPEKSSLLYPKPRVVQTQTPPLQTHLNSATAQKPQGLWFSVEH